MPGLVFRVQKIQVVDGSGRFPVGLHTGNSAVFAAVTLFLLDHDSFHFSSLSPFGETAPIFSGPRAFPE
jgi:hypothetical protein